MILWISSVSLFYPPFFFTFLVLLICPFCWLPQRTKSFSLILWIVLFLFYWLQPSIYTKSNLHSVQKLYTKSAVSENTANPLQVQMKETNDDIPHRTDRFKPSWFACPAGDSNLVLNPVKPLTQFRVMGNSAFSESKATMALNPHQLASLKTGTGLVSLLYYWKSTDMRQVK